MKNTVKEVKTEGMYVCSTKRIHILKENGNKNCNLKQMSKKNQNTKYTKVEINSKIKLKRLHLSKCDWCLLIEDIEVE